MNLEQRKSNFIDKSNIKFGCKFDFSLVDYINIRTEIIIICPIHGETKQIPNIHLMSVYGCPDCALENAFDTKEEFIIKAKLKHYNKRVVEYDYSLVDYIGYKNKVIIICNIHGEFTQTPNDHLNGCGCLKCTDWYKTHDEFVSESNIKHNNKYTYPEEYKGVHTKILIKCPKHDDFKQEPNLHLKGAGCPTCNSSKGELLIEQYLKQNNIIYEKQKKFDDCKYKNKLKFDFYLSELNLCVEFDGRQHYEPIEQWGGVEYFKEQQLRDNIKNIFCEKTYIKLLRIKYDENIEQKLKENIII